MDEQQLRALVRESIARHLAGSGSAASGGRRLPETPAASHARFSVATGEDGDGPCLIEPAVRCTHCGYCQSYGH